MKSIFFDCEYLKLTASLKQKIKEASHSCPFFYLQRPKQFRRGLDNRVYVKEFHFDL